MLVMKKLINACAGILLVGTLCAGCAAPQVRERYFWPPPPDTPRIEWLGAYGGEDDMAKKGFIDALTGGAEAGEGELFSPMYITADGKGKVYISDLNKLAVIVFDLNTKRVHSLGGTTTAGLFDLPTGIALDAGGNIYAADAKSRKILTFGPSENFLGSIDLSKELISISSIAIDKTRNNLIVPDVKGHKVVIYSLTAKAIIKTLNVDAAGKPDDELRFNYPTSASVDNKGNIWICDAMNARIMKYSPEGVFISKFGRRGDGAGDFNIIKTAAVDSEGHIYVTDGKEHRISVFDDSGTVLLMFGGPYALKGVGSQVTPGGFLLPNGIFIDQNDTIYIVDQQNGRFQMFQYVTERYLKEHPITIEAPAAKAELPSDPKK